MQKRSAFTAETNRGLVFQRILNQGVLSKLALYAYAEEGEGKPEEGGEDPKPSVNFEQMISQARKEEKDKLYPRIQKAEEEKKVLTESVNKYLLEIAALKEELEKAKNDSANLTKIKELEGKIADLEIENKTLKENAPNEEEIRKKIEAEYEIKLYAQEQISANKDSIISILIPEITGNTKEEIDTAIANAKEKTKAVKKDLGISVEDDDGEDKSKKKSQTTTTTKSKKVPVAAPASEESGEEYDAEYIRNLDPRSKEYAEFRKKMGLK